MNARGIVIAAALLAAASAQAQLLDTSTSRLGAQTLPGYGPLASGFKRYSPVYGGNEAANPNDRQFKEFRTDPRLVLGYAFNPHFALEAGYSHLFDEGFHKINPYQPTEQAIAAGALGVKSYTVHAAAKVSLPLSERLSAYGKLGIAHSQLKDDGTLGAMQEAPTARGVAVGTSDKGPFGAVGAKYKLNDRATVSGEYRINGSASKFGNASNASGVRGSIGVGF
ncbi:outer membrane beta-barrel protein [Massilia consociata]|uniref:Outer membrane beta-barrel protein n=1 Tax=Massilia consociata TaxID=760117 RepID=A0ABV6FLS6_9BURK